MSWFVFALVCTLFWGFADLFYKKSSDENEKFSHLKIAVWVGMVMGVCSILLLIFSDDKMSLSALFSNAVKYLPASLSYIISMVIGYAGLRYLELSIVSPVQNASGALSAVVMLLYFIFIGKINNFFDEFSVLDIVGTVIIVFAVISLALVEHNLYQKTLTKKENSKYRFGALALLFPLLYCVFDTIGTAADGIILSDSSGLSLSEIDVIILYGLTFFLMSVILYIFLFIKEKKPYNPFTKTELPKMSAAICEEGGQVFYVFAMARNPVLSAPMVASYCIVSVILSRILLKEKLTKPQYACVLFVILGIVILGISEGIANI